MRLGVTLTLREKKVTEKKTKNFSNICDWFVDNKLSIYFGGINEITILFSTKNKKKGKLEHLIQPHFDYACSTWNPNRIKKFKK